MADPLTVLGGVAASVQLLDVAAKLSKELYSFFRSVRGANADTQRQLDILDDLQATLGLVASFISSRPTARLGILINGDISKLETVLQKLCNDLRSVQILIPPGPHISFAAKTRWTLKKKDFEARLKEIESRKTSMLLILEVLFVQDQKLLLGKTDAIETAVQSLSVGASHAHLLNTTILDSVSTLSADTETHRTGIERTLRDIAYAIPRDGEKTRTAIEAHREQLHRVGDMLSHHSAHVGEWMSAQTQLMQDLAAALPRETSRTDHGLNDLVHLTSMTGPCPRQTSSDYKLVHKTEHLLAHIARDEIRRAMAPVLEALGQSQVRNETLAKSLNEVLDDVSSRLWNDDQLNEGSERQSENPQNPRTTTTHYLYPQTMGTPNSTDLGHLSIDTREQLGGIPTSDFPLYEPSSDPEIEKELERLNCQTSYRPSPVSGEHYPKYRTIWMYWSTIPWLGNMRIEIRRRKRWLRNQASWSSDISILVTFWPVWPLLRSRGLSLLYMTEPLYNGYHQIMPAITTIPVIPFKERIWDLISNDASCTIQHEIATGRVNVNTQTEDGRSLLHWACFTLSFDACNVLLKMGADPTKDQDKIPLLECLLDVAWDVMVWEHKKDLHVSKKAILQLIRQVVQAGSDINDCLWRPANLDVYPGPERGWLRPSVKKSAELAELAAFLRQSHQNPWSALDEGLIDLLQRTSMHIATALECGLDPNYSESAYHSPIFALLQRAVHFRRFAENFQADFSVENLAFLLTAGANKYTLFWAEGEAQDYNPWSRVLTPSIYAITQNVTDIWEAALREVGLDPTKVYAEDERRVREFLRLREETYGAPTSLDLRSSVAGSSLRLREGRAYKEA